MLCYVCYVMLCYVMFVMLCYVMLCLLCYVMLCYVMLCYVMLCYEQDTNLDVLTMEILGLFFTIIKSCLGFPGGSLVENPPANE